ncbi:hypothetical protein NP493_1691g00018, partial [Ridgeia piscesae]
AYLFQYQHPDIAKRDILNVFNSYKDLRPVLDSFVFNDGTRKELLCLDGTVPVPYKRNIYNIPICLWLMDTHPFNPPMVFVMPTSTMMLKTGRHIDGTGRVYLPYLHEWKPPQADLLGLFQAHCVWRGSPSLLEGCCSRQTCLPSHNARWEHAQFTTRRPKSIDTRNGATMQ